MENTLDYLSDLASLLPSLELHVTELEEGSLYILASDGEMYCEVHLIRPFDVKAVAREFDIALGGSRAKQDREA